MLGRIWRYLLTIVLLGIVFLLFVRDTAAQNSYTVTLTPPDTSAFPNLSAYLDVHGPSGEFVHGLTMPDVTILENGAPIPVNALNEKKPGVQFVMAISPGSALTIRDASGTSRYQYLLQGLFAGAWVQQPSGGDDLNLLTAGGPQLVHSSDPAALRSSLESYQPTETNPAPSLEVLASALQVATDPTPRKGMERAILFITPPQTTDVSLGLQSIVSSANQQNIHIFVWLVASPEVFDYPETDLLRNLASQTRGTFFAFSHDETVPDLNDLLEPLRYVYQLGYDSRAVTPGAQQVAAQVNIGSEQVTSQTQTFNLNLLPPGLIILNPPTEIQRKFLNQPTPGVTRTSNDLQPIEIQLDIQASFPDGYTRSLARTSLYVDGQVVAENTTPPADKLVWDLRPFTQAGTHTVKVEATDSLGLVGRTSEISVRITVPSATQEVVAAVAQKRGLIIAITVVISASILILVLIVGGRIHPKPYPGQVSPTTASADKVPRTGYRARLRQLRDPVTQPVNMTPHLPAKLKTGLGAWRGRLPWFQRKASPPSALASLIPLAGSDEPTIPLPLQINEETVTLGSDPQRASLVIDDPSIDGLHARIHYAGGSFHLTDAGSVAGTWVNYEQVSPQGKVLSHADIIHLGRVGFRFSLPEPGAPRELMIRPLEPDQ